MAFAGLKKQINKCNQYMTEKMGGAEGTKLDVDFVDMERGARIYSVRVLQSSGFLMQVVDHHRKKLQGRRLDFDCKRRRQAKGNPKDDEIRQAEEKFAESLHLAQLGMFNLLENDVEQVSQLVTFAEALYEYHQQCTEIMKTVVENLQEKLSEAANRPKHEFVPKTLADLHVEGISEGMNGTSVFRVTPPTAPPSTEAWHRLSAPPRASPLPSPVKSSPARTPINNPGSKSPCCTALYDFEPENPGELGFKEGDTILLTQAVDENWFEGSLNGRTGYFPVSYVQVVVPLP
ncbi:hypothetical protein LSTR_LSTR008478 [Laodelphax striatellus]|uniref:Endophilin-A n=1 Tax=Laodelphax striatellus TaxID=195883 RepID=A0A482X2A6_LAOST|nr:hypothetical protein LSTR_LSTR008478 [Laodelphax striatellus]